MTKVARRMQRRMKATPLETDIPTMAPLDSSGSDVWLGRAEEEEGVEVVRVKSA
jgi:hypothetical protein